MKSFFFAARQSFFHNNDVFSEDKDFLGENKALTLRGNIQIYFSLSKINARLIPSKK